MISQVLLFLKVLWSFTVDSGKQFRRNDIFLSHAPLQENDYEVRFCNLTDVVALSYKHFNTSMYRSSIWRLNTARVSIESKKSTKSKQNGRLHSSVFCIACRRNMVYGTTYSLLDI